MSTNPIVPYTFVPGTKAKAQEVNANFVSIADAIQTNNTTFTQKINEIESSIEAASSNTEEELSAINTSLTNKADKNLSNVTTLASASAKGITWFGTATSNVASTRPAVIVTSYLSGSTWYRLYSDKWVEQGGIAQATNTKDTDVTITFPKAFKNTNYSFCYSSMLNVDQNTTYYTKFDVGCYQAQAAANMKIKVRSSFKRVLWYACGYTN